jgi:hypothetical protein
MSSQTLELLEKAIHSKDADKVEFALATVSDVDFDRSLVPVLIELVEANWHSRHEDVARMLQQLGDARSVDALFNAAHATHGYLDFDDGSAFARKCTWALADIGSLLAKQRLLELSKETNKIVAGFAQKRLDNWSKEASRKKNA